MPMTDSMRLSREVVVLVFCLISLPSPSHLAQFLKACNVFINNSFSILNIDFVKMG